MSEVLPNAPFKTDQIADDSAAAALISTQELTEENGFIGEGVMDLGNGHVPVEEDLLDLQNNDSAMISISGFSLEVVRLIKAELDNFIMKKIKAFESTESSGSAATRKAKTYVSFYKELLVDKSGAKVKIGETGITEGWNVPKYENEFQNLLGFPFTEDHSFRIRKPRQECFNCLATNHKIQDCPVKADQERIDLHRKSFNVQAHQANEQSQLFTSNRYSSVDQNGGGHRGCRGFVPGQISQNLRKALGVRDNQLPPYIYMMRNKGYPIGWLLEAQEKVTNLSVLDGVAPVNKTAVKRTHDGEEKVGSAPVVAPSSAEESDAAAVVVLDETNGEAKDEPKIENEEEVVDISSSAESPKVITEIVIQYDADKIYNFPGFNQPVPANMIEESRNFDVRPYSDDLSKEAFLRTLKLVEKKKVVTRVSTANDLSRMDSQAEDLGEEVDEHDPNNSKEEETNLEDEIEDDTAPQNDGDFVTPKISSRKRNNILGTSISESPGTPLVKGLSGVEKVPQWEKFNDGICEHKPFDMEGQSTGGSYQAIVEITKKHKEDLKNNANNLNVAPKNEITLD